MNIPKKLLNETTALIEDIKNDNIDLSDLWFEELPYNPITKNIYSGYNMLYLNSVANRKSYKRNLWMTFKQIEKGGGTVKKGSKSYPVIFWKLVKKKHIDEKNIEDEKDKYFPVINYYNVFNLEQIEGIDFPKQERIQPYESVDDFVKDFNPKIIYGGNSSYYLPSKDEIHLPDIDNFNSVDDYYNVLFHELSHWTSSKNRLNRTLSTNPNDVQYAKEELIAELSSYFISNFFGFKTKPKTAGYLKSWLDKLDFKPEYLIQVAANSYKVFEFFFGKNELAKE